MVYETCTEQLSPFGGLLALIKFLDLVDFQALREPKLGHYRMMVEILMLLFTRFNLIWHFVYIRLDALLCGFFGLSRLLAASTFWRYGDSLGINQGQSLLKVMRILRERVWQLCGFRWHSIRINIDTTVKTVYGDQQRVRKGYNPTHRGKEGFRPLLAFIEETREYLLCKLLQGATVDGKRCTALIAAIQNQLHGCVQEVLIRTEGEFLCWDSVQAALNTGFDFIIANRGCTPVFDAGWYRPWKRQSMEFNSCFY